MVKNKEIQEQRMRDYFIQATKEILKAEGLRGVSVRNIADKAGYSYATLYNYFKDVNDLIFLCVSDFQEECEAYVGSKAADDSAGVERLKSLVLAYMGYFVEYPGIFDLFYMAQVADFGNKQTTIDVINNSLDNVCRREWESCITKGIFSAQKSEILRIQLKYMVIGLMLFYLNRRIPSSYLEFMDMANNQLSAFFEAR